jgi:cellulose synthase (UDP-forming)
MPAPLPLLAWTAATIAMLALATAPIGVTAELALGSAVIVAMFAVKRIGSGAVQRHAYLALGTLIVLRYVWWRTTETLPATDDLVGFSAGVVLYAAEMFCVGMLFVSLFVIADPLRRPPARRLKPEECPRVDVFVPSYDESADLVAATLAAATTMDWPADKLRVHLPDDGGTVQKRNAADPVAAAAAQARHEEMKALAAELGATYLTREKNVSAKAGDRKSTRLNSSHNSESRMPSSA